MLDFIATAYEILKLSVEAYTEVDNLGVNWLFRVVGYWELLRTQSKVLSLKQANLELPEFVVV
jgi:hypothetical protein